MFTPRRFIVLIVLGTLLLSSCSLPAATPSGEEPNLIYTAAAQTVAAQMTQSATDVEKTPVPPTQAPTATLAPTSTTVPPTAVQPTAAPQHTATRVPPTAVPVPCNSMEFIKDVNYKDGTEVDPGQVFDKTWRVKNTGSCTWTSSYTVVFDKGDAMHGPASTQLTNGTVPPGGTVDITVENLKAPQASGTYKGYWKLRDGSGNTFGYGDADKSFWVQIVVASPVTYNFLAKAKDAEWHNATQELSFGDKNDDDPGIAAYGNDVEMEDGQTYGKVLGTYPQRIEDGVIYGIFSKYTVKDGDHFRAEVGFPADCNNAKVYFQLMYLDGSNLVTLKEWKKTCDNELLTLDYDLSDLEGESIQFVLGVDAFGSFRADKAMWVDPRIQK